MADQHTKTGLIYVLIGPSGVGKNTMMKAALQQLNNLRQLPTATTRGPRNDEREGREHYFVSPEQFKALIQKEALLEHQEIHDEHYGIIRETVEEALVSGDDLIADIDILGAKVLREEYAAHVRSVFISAADKSTLEARIRARGDEDEDKINIRLQRADYEMLYAPHCDYLIINEDLDEACAELVGIIQATRSARNLRRVSVGVFIMDQAGYVLADTSTNAPALPRLTVRPDEEPLAAARRLVYKLGFDLNEITFTRRPNIVATDAITPVHFYLRQAGSQPVMELVFACAANTRKPGSLEPGLEWIKPDDLPLAASIEPLPTLAAEPEMLA